MDSKKTIEELNTIKRSLFHIRHRDVNIHGHPQWINTNNLIDELIEKLEEPDPVALVVDVFDLLYLDFIDGRELYNRRKEHDSETLSQVVDAILRHLGGHVIDNADDETASFKKALRWRLSQSKSQKTGYPLVVEFDTPCGKRIYLACDEREQGEIALEALERNISAGIYRGLPGDPDSESLAKEAEAALRSHDGATAWKFLFDNPVKDAFAARAVVPLRAET